jgi:hypothetical protein
MFGASAGNGITGDDLLRFQPPPWKFGAGPESAFAQDSRVR